MSRNKATVDLGLIFWILCVCVCLSSLGIQALSLLKWTPQLMMYLQIMMSKGNILSLSLCLWSIYSPLQQTLWYSSPVLSKLQISNHLLCALWTKRPATAIWGEYNHAHTQIKDKLLQCCLSIFVLQGGREVSDFITYLKKEATNPLILDESRDEL